MLYEKYYLAKEAEGRARSTLDSYRFHFRILFLYADHVGREPNIDRMDVEFYRHFVNWMRDEYVKNEGHKYKPESAKTVGLSATSINSVLKTLRNFYDFLIAEGLADHNPLHSVKNVRQVDKDITVLTADELRALLSAPDQRRYADFRDYVLMTLLLDSMMRINEACQLTRDDVDFNDCSVHIRADNVKTRKSRRVPIQRRTARLMKELVAEVSVFEDTELIFLANYGGSLTPNHFRHRLEKFAKQAEISKNVHPHLFRHTGATMALENGMDIRHLQMILGHADLRMTMRYTHLSDKSLSAQHERYSPMSVINGTLNKNRKILR